MAVAAEVEENHARLAFGLGFESLVNGFGDGVIGFGRGYDALGARELHTGGEGVELLHGDGIGEPEIDDVRNQRRHAVITQAAGVNARRHEGAAQGMHLH